MDCELLGIDFFNLWYNDSGNGPFKIHCFYNDGGEDYYDDNLYWAVEELIYNELENHVIGPLDDTLNDYLDELEDYVDDVMDQMEHDVEDAFEDDVEEIEEWADQTLPEVLDWLD